MADRGCNGLARGVDGRDRRREATVGGKAQLAFAGGQRVEIAVTPFLREARRTLLARYVALRSEELDAVLERARILPYFAEFTEQAGNVPSGDDPPQLSLNRPFAAPAEAEAEVWKEVATPRA